MNPILLGRHVEQGLRELVHSTLNTTSSGFEGAVERFLNNPNHFMKGPWVTVDLPFKNIEDTNGNWTQPFPQIPLKFAPYIHGANCIEVIELFNDAIYHIERNAHPKILFLDISLKLTKLLRVKQPQVLD